MSSSSTVLLVLVVLLLVLLANHAHAQAPACEDEHFPNQGLTTAAPIALNSRATGKLCASSRFDYFESKTAAASSAGFVTCQINTTSVTSSDLATMSFHITPADSFVPEPVRAAPASVSTFF